MKIAISRCPQAARRWPRDRRSAAQDEAARLTAAFVDQAGATIRPCKQEILDIDDTFCAALGGQQLAFWNAHHYERGFASMHI
jgi:hypothetical protein